MRTIRTNTMAQGEMANWQPTVTGGLSTFFPVQNSV